MELSVSIELPPATQAAIARYGDTEGLYRALVPAMDAQTDILLARVREKRFRQSGPESLGIVSARLWQSLRTSAARVVAGGVESAIGSNVKYLRVHEFGAPARTIVPKNAKVLRFKIGGKVVFAKKVNLPATPARAPLRRGIQDRLPEMSAAMAEATLAFYANKK